MTDKTHQDSGIIAATSDILLHDAKTALMYEELRAAIDDGHESMTHADALAEIAAIRAENIKLRAQLEAVGAGGVSGSLVGRAAPPTAQAEGWRPIETAPKDGTAILLGSREDLAIWKRRALEAERDLRAERETASRLAAEINAINGPTRLGEPAPTAQPAPAAVAGPSRQFTDGTRSLRQDCISAIRDFASSRPEDDEDWESWFEAAFGLCESRLSTIFDEHAAAPNPPTSAEGVEHG